MNSLPQLSDFRAVLFDVDGTLISSVPMIVAGLGDMLEKYAGTRPDRAEIEQIIGLPLRSQINLYLPDADEAAVMEMARFAIERFEEHKNLEEPFIPSIQAMVSLYECGYKIALVTSKSKIELEQFLSRFPASDAIHTTVCASDVSNPKPDPESAILACQKMGVTIQESLMIGDSIYDLRCAKAAGMLSVGVAYGATPFERLQEENPAYIFETPEAVLNWVQSTATNKHAKKEEFIASGA